jgi:hypothetical protein
MKKTISILLLSLIFTSCKKDTPAPTPPSTGPCNCGEIIQLNMSDFSFLVKNNCTGNYGTFQVSADQFTSSGPGMQYCQAIQW